MAMGEPTTCLVSSPIQQEVNPMRVLGESISFGRFMSESLDWERWSTFTHKRYVEEAEKYSKPGSVAAKKAYFEAHYKRKAQEKAAALNQEASAQANGTFDSETQEGNHTETSAGKKSKVDNIVEQTDKDAVNYQVVDDTNQYKCDVWKSDLDIPNVEGVAEDMAPACVDTNLNLENHVLDDNSNKEIVVPVEERIPDPGTAGYEVLALPVKGREVDSSPKLSIKTTMAKLSHSLNKRKDTAALPPLKSGTIGKKSDRSSFEKTGLRSLHMSINLPFGTGKSNKTAAAVEQSRNSVNSVLKSKKSDGSSFEKMGPTAQSLHMSINLPSGTGKRNKTATAAEQSRNGVNSVSKSKKTVQGSVELKGLTARSLHMSINLPSGAGETSKTATAAVNPRNGINRASKIMKVVGESVEKRPTSRSLHMSINFPSGAGLTSKSPSVFEHNRSKKLDSNLPSVSKHHSVASQTLTKASHGFSNQASANPPSQGRRTERLLNKSVSEDVTANAKFSSISMRPKSSSTTKSNLGSLTTSSPFRFRSEERAVKRKEFLQRVDENKSKEEEKVHLQRIPKEKTELDHKKLRQISGSKSKLHEDRHGGSQSQNNQIRKDKNLGNSWKPPISTNNTKRVTEKINRATRQSVTSLSNMTRENASPNIQQ